MPRYDVVLLPSFAQVEDWRKREASRLDEGLFAQTVSTFNAWITDLWELHGDGRAIADSLQRRTVMQAAFSQLSDEDTGGNPSAAEIDDGGLTVSPGVVKLAGRCVRDAAGVPSFEHAVEQVRGGELPDGLSLREAALLQGIARYFDLLQDAGLVEVGSAAAILAAEASRVFPHGARVLMAGGAPLDWRMESFFGACEQVSVDVAETAGASGVERVPDGVQLQFGFPAGRYAQPALVADLVRGLAAAGLAGDDVPSTVVACADPLALYKQVEGELAADGMRVCVQAQVPFSSTDFGRQFMSVAKVVHGDVFSKESLSDAARPPFSGFSADEAIDVDRALRGNRIADRDACLEQLRVASDTFSQLEELASEPDADVLLGVFEQMAVDAPYRSPAWKNEQLAAASALRSCTKAARMVGADMRVCVSVLEDAVVTVSYEGVCSTQASRGEVLVTTQQAAAQMGAGSCDQLILCDLTSDDYRVADKDDAEATLFDKLGLSPTDTALARARRTFALLQALPSGKLVCLRPLNDWDGNPTYPAAMLQELVDLYRVDATADDDVDEVFGLPAELRESLVQRGEELMFANAGARPAESIQPMAGTVELGPRDELAAAERELVPLRRRGSDGLAQPGFSPSPSQVEAYLECPGMWFARNRLKLEGIDEGFGAIERGSFAHAVLREFYQRFKAEGNRKVDEQNLQQARELMRVVADEVHAVQESLDPGSGRYVAATQMEQREVDACKEQLVAYLDFEAAFLPTFHPEYLEYAILPEDGVEYAGHPFIGVVDRIDVDDAGNAVIVDYKGSVGPHHEIAGKTKADPGKVQTRMYAQAVRRKLGLNVVGALYVSYGKTRGCAGAFDPRIIEAPHVPSARVERCSCAIESARGASTPASEELDFADLSFADMLDCTEDLVNQAIGAMQMGKVQPAPARPDVCVFCPASTCPRRSA